MSEFRFSCPKCRRDILCDVSYAGSQINCPICQKPITVPSPQAKATGGSSGGGSGSGAMRTVLIVAAVVVVLAALGVGGWFGYSKFKASRDTKKANPAAQVTAPTSASTIQALSILSKVHAAYTNVATARGDDTVTLFLSLSNITMADVSPNRPADAKNAARHPPGMPNLITNTTELSVKRAQPDWYYVAGEAVSKIDRQIITNTFAYWSSDKGKFMFTDSHQRGMPATYMQMGTTNSPNPQQEQFKNLQNIFGDPAQLAKIIKDMGQTDDESVNGQACFTVTAKVLGQKVKIWVDKTSYLISQWQITLGGTISDADIDDAFEVYGLIVTNTPPPQLGMIKTQVKKMTPVMTKIRGTITSTSKNIEINPALSADDFNYPVPRGVRLLPMPAAMASANATATSTETRWRNTCINDLRQMDAAKNQFALEKNKKTGDPVTEDDIKPYIKLDAGGNLPKCPAGGKYTIGKVGEAPTCSIPGHVLP